MTATEIGRKTPIPLKTKQIARNAKNDPCATPNCAQFAPQRATANHRKTKQIARNLHRNRTCIALSRCAPSLLRKGARATGATNSPSSEAQVMTALRVVDTSLAKRRTERRDRSEGVAIHRSDLGEPWT